jgi:hypothetical protein
LPTAIEIEAALNEALQAIFVADMTDGDESPARVARYRQARLPIVDALAWQHDLDPGETLESSVSETVVGLLTTAIERMQEFDAFRYRSACSILTELRSKLSQ